MLALGRHPYCARDSEHKIVQRPLRDPVRIPALGYNRRRGGLQERLHLLALLVVQHLDRLDHVLEQHHARRPAAHLRREQLRRRQLRRGRVPLRAWHRKRARSLPEDVLCCRGLLCVPFEGAHRGQACGGAMTAGRL